MGELGSDKINVKDVDKHCRPFSREKDGKRHETDEERRIRKEKEREERHRKEGRPMETEEERAIRKEKERREKESRRKHETEEERAIRKEKERREKEYRHPKEGHRKETEEERRIRKEKEAERRNETDEQRRMRKEREREEKHRKEGRKDETEEERRIRKEKERADRGNHERRKHETEEERRIRKEKERKERGDKQRSKSKDNDKPDKNRNETEEERRIRKERERRKRKEKEAEEQQEQLKKEQDIKEEEEDEIKEVEPNNNFKKRKNRESEEDYVPSKKQKSSVKKEIKDEPKKEVKDEYKEVKAEETGEKVKWWEQETPRGPGDKKWHFLQHNGPIFAPEYEPLPDNVKFYYDKKPLKLNPNAEEIATFYGRMIDHDYTTKQVFNKNFFKDWRKAMNETERKLIRDLSLCDFTEIDAHFKAVSEQRKSRSKEVRKAEKEKNEALQKEYGVCIIAYDKHETPYPEKIGNYRIEPPGLFRGRGEHPKQGCVKLRVMPEDVTINCSKNAEVPKPPKGHKWREIRHDNTVTWLATWTENVQNQNKYVMLNPSSKMKAENDMLKYEKARRLKHKIDEIRANYTADWKNKEMAIRQRAVALYFIDKLALRAGHEKGEDQADTVGCCSLRVEHLTLHEEKDGKEYVVEFDFLGKDSIRYYNDVPVEKRVFKNLKLFMENKKKDADLFDRLTTESLNEYLKSLMPDLSAKVFRTYNASITLQEQLKKLTEPDDNLNGKVLSYNRANREVAILCNHQKAVSKTFDKTMENLQAKIDGKIEQKEKAEKEYKIIKKEFKNGGQYTKADVEKKKKQLEMCLEQLNKLETQKLDKDENKTVALGTSKLNYMDPRISVAWCKKWDIPVKKVFTTKTHQEKFQWAIEMVMNSEEEYIF